jgi:hypothetical protein
MGELTMKDALAVVIRLVEFADNVDLTSSRVAKGLGLHCTSASLRGELSTDPPTVCVVCVFFWCAPQWCTSRSYDVATSLAPRAMTPALGTTRKKAVKEQVAPGVPAAFWTPCCPRKRACMKAVGTRMRFKTCLRSQRPVQLPRNAHAVTLGRLRLQLLFQNPVLLTRTSRTVRISMSPSCCWTAKTMAPVA